MDYLTKYYKNLSEELQAQVNYLQNLLNEEGDMKADAEYADLMNSIKNIGSTKSKQPTECKPDPRGRIICTPPRWPSIVKPEDKFDRKKYMPTEEEMKKMMKEKDKKKEKPETEYYRG